MKRRLRHAGLLCAAALLAAGLAYVLLERTPDLADAASAGRLPHIRPDYSDTVLPPNIAPTNFRVEESGRSYAVVVQSEKGRAVRVFSKSRDIRIPQKPWRDLLQANRGGQIVLNVFVQGGDGHWQRFEPITNTVAAEDIDPYLVYRLIDSAYNFYFRVGLYERDLRDYGESVVLRSESMGDGCMNCHTFLGNSSDRMVLHIREGPSRYGSGMLLIERGSVRKVDTRTKLSPGLAGFTAWHPSGRLVVFSLNNIRQFFHAARAETRDVVDMGSDLAVYALATHTVTSTSAISAPGRLETWPTWSPDGRYLYFCSAPLLWTDRDKVPPERYRDVRYDLMRISYDISNNTWGSLETVLSAAKTALSITQPRVSPDGRFLVFCMSEYSTFPSFQPRSDLYLLDLRNGRYARLGCNSDRSESWHSWSSNSRWLVFSSKRDDGQSIRAYFTYIDADGMARKPFVLPQEDPAFYDSFVDLCQLPELVRERMPMRGEAIAEVIRSGAWEKTGLPVTAASPRAVPREAAPPGAAPLGSTGEPWQTHR